MGTFLVTLLIMLLVVSALAVGVIFGRKPLAGSCGGVGAALGQQDYVCDICGGDEAKCQAEREGKSATDATLAYEVTSSSAGNDNRSSKSSEA